MDTHSGILLSLKKEGNGECLAGWHTKGPGFDSQYCINDRKGDSETIYPMEEFAGHCVCGNTTDPEIQTRNDLVHCHSGKVPRIVIL